MTLDNIIEEMLGDIQPGTDPIFYRVGCVKMAAPRHSRFEFLINLGRADIDKLFKHKPFRATQLTFVFPERWMGVHEQYGMIATLQNHPDAGKLERVDIITSSPIIIGNFMRESVRVLTWDDDDKHNGKVQ